MCSTVTCSFNTQRISGVPRYVRTLDIQRKIRFHMLFSEETYGAIVFLTKKLENIKMNLENLLSERS